MIQFFIIFPDGTKCFTPYFMPENNWVEGMTVIDCENQWEYDGQKWVDVQIDHL